MKVISEIFLTTNNVEEKSWLEFFNNISNLNGKLRRWDFYVSTENNEVRYFTRTRKQLPTVIGSLGDFLIKRIDYEADSTADMFLKGRAKSNNGLPYILKHKENNILDVYDKFEVKKSKILKLSKMSVFSVKRDYFLYRTYLYLEDVKENLIKRRILLAIPQEFFNIDFSEHARFVYRKDDCKYLNIEKSLHLFKTDKEDSILKIDAFPYLLGNYYLRIDSYDFDKHSVIVGASGTGKSKLICSMIEKLNNRLQYREKYKVVMIDPHASMADDLEGIESTQIVNFQNAKNAIDLFTHTGKDITVSVELILCILKGLIKDQYNSKLERVLRQSICVLLTKNELTFYNLKKLILDLNYRSETIRETEEKLPESTREFFLVDFNELKNRSYQEAIAPIISFIDEMQLLPAFQNSTKQKGLKETIEENFLTIFSLDQTVLGEKVTKTIAGLVMQQMLELVQAYSFDKHIIFIIDEVAVVENEILNRFLSEARKYNLSLMLSGQYFNQISNSLQKAIFANVLNYYIFRVSKEDAIILEGNMLMEVAIHNTYYVKRTMLTKLGNRECIVRVCESGKVLSPFKAKTMDFTPIKKEVVNQILDANLILLDTNKENTKKLEQEETIDFSLDTEISLTELMLSQT